MIRSQLCLVAESVIRDADTNNVSVINILEGITAEGFPVLVQRLAFFALLERDASDTEQTSGQFTTTFNGKTLQEVKIDLNFQGKLKNRVTVNVRGLIIPEPGIITFSLTLSTGATASYAVEAIALSGAQSTSS